MVGIREAYRMRLPMTIGVLSLIAGIGLWINAWLVIYDASRLSGPVEGDWMGLFWRVFFCGFLLIAGTYLLTRHAKLLKSDLRNDPILRMMRKKGV
jgi:hypothetical protein